MTTVLVVGGGGREHTLCWSLGKSSRVDRILVAPGNAGTALAERCENLEVGAGDLAGLVDAARRESVDLVAVGPEAPLAAGLADAMEAIGVPTFGPSADCARLEASKAYCKTFLNELSVPTAASATFREPEPALAYLDQLPSVPVIKASGLAAGKGVVVAETPAEAAAAIRAMLVDGRFGEAGREVVVEERLRGTEISVLAFSDGNDFVVMPAAQDHKRIFDGDRGPNTGGMGAFVPSPFATGGLIGEVSNRIIRPTLDALAAAGTPYRGVIYFGLMLTEEGPRVLEINCRLGDPETQAVLPLLESDLFEVMLGCATGSLGGVQVEWSGSACTTVVMSSAGYPTVSAKPAPISGLKEAVIEGCLVFHAGTSLVDGVIHATGGRVLGVTALGNTLPEATERAYAGVEAITFEGSHHRLDIGRRPLPESVRVPLSHGGSIR
ncbi:MAG: phosphoribosylamine--glycine ligase [bacterium]|nr:phosphoribosylamine--glycine ligase [bacterium]MDE0290548.1 phosphoribosylamine--glycine ligase [bacterium]MDE0436943.1 phosphoribosylamine--glycine ligase [bacterium]